MMMLKSMSELIFRERWTSMKIREERESLEITDEATINVLFFCFVKLISEEIESCLTYCTFKLRRLCIYTWISIFSSFLSRWCLTSDRELWSQQWKTHWFIVKDNFVEKDKSSEVMKHNYITSDKSRTCLYKYLQNQR